jgi:nicotinamidase-related amidase
VLSTVCDSADRDYRLVVLSDACADPDEEVHRVLLTKVFARRADVITIDELAKRLG